jgi:hypothetical protein
MITVSRRFSDFVKFRQALTNLFAPLVIPQLPSKQIYGTLQPEFIEGRRRDLQNFLKTVVKHPVLRASAVTTSFLNIEDDEVSISTFQSPLI